MATYPRVETPHRQGDGSYVVRIHASASKVTEYPAKDIKTARQVFQLVRSVVDALEVAEPAPLRVDRAGRKTLLTPEIQAAVVRCLVEGQMTWKRVANAIGVTERSIMRWLDEGERVLDRLEAEGDDYEEPARDVPYRLFFQACQKARSDMQRELLSRIKVAGHREWTANAWLLERMWHQEFGRRQVMTHVGLPIAPKGREGT